MTIASQNDTIKLSQRVITEMQQLETIARLTVKGPGLMTRKMKRYIAEWLRKQAKTLETNKEMTPGRYIARWSTFKW